MSEPFICPSCKSEGFLPSKLGPHRCTFCDGTESGQGPTEQDVLEKQWRLANKVPKPPWIEHLTTEAGSFKRIRGTFEFITNAGDFRYGDFLFILADGTHVDCKRLLNFYDTFLALARLEPQDVQVFVDEINSTPQALQKGFAEAHNAFMKEKYPGALRRKLPPEEVKSETLNVEDLEL